MTLGLPTREREQINCSHPVTAVHAPQAIQTRLIIIGPGKVGSALIAQISQHLQAPSNTDLRVIAVCRQAKMLTHPDGICLRNWRELLNQSDQSTDLNLLDAFVTDLAASEPLLQMIIVDTTASSAVADQHAHWLNKGYHVITANKAGPAGPQAVWNNVQACVRQPRRSDSSTPVPLYGIETTVGAALPLIDTLRKLVSSGDIIHRIDGVFSGSLAWIFNQIHNGIRPSDAIRQAHQAGLTEPDPRDDLSGLDVARKLLILARETGWCGDLDEVPVPDLLPEALSACTTAQFLSQLHLIDEHLSPAINSARQRHQKLLVDGCIDRHGLRASLSMHDLDQPFSLASASDNIVRIYTRRYGEHPLLIQGAGAGIELTASGLLTELVSIIKGL